MGVTQKEPWYFQHAHKTLERHVCIFWEKHLFIKVFENKILIKNEIYTIVTKERACY